MHWAAGRCTRACGRGIASRGRPPANDRRPMSHPRAHRGTSDWWLGIALTGALAAIGMAAAEVDWVQRLGLSGLTVAIACGIIAGNTFFPLVATRTAAGVDFSKSRLLRTGIILYGFRITFQQIAEVGWS